MARALKERLEGAGLGLLACLGLAWALLLAWHASSFNDEWLFLGNARRILHGDWPHRDYFQFIPTAAEWLLAPALWAFPGHPLAVAHGLNALLALAVAWGLWRLGRGQGLSPSLACLAPAFWAWACLPHWPAWSQHHLALGVGLLALGPWLVQPWGTRWAFASGLGVGLGGLVLQSDAVALAGALGLWGLWRWRQAAWGGDGLRWAGAWFGGMALAFLPYPVLLAWGGAWPALVDQVLWWPLSHYRQSGGLNDVRLLEELAHFGLGQGLGAWGRAWHAWGLLAVVLGAAPLAWVAAWRRGASEGPSPEALVGLSLLLGLLLAVASRGRQDLTHLSMVAPWAALLWAWAAAAWPEAWARRGLAALLASVALTGGLWQLALMRAKPGLWLRLASPDARLAEHPAHRWAEAHLRPGDRILAVPYGGYVYAHWGRPATAHGILTPPEAAYLGRAQWEEAGRALKAFPPRWLVVDGGQGPKAYLDLLGRPHRLLASWSSPLQGPGSLWRVYRMDVGASTSPGVGGPTDLRTRGPS